MSNPIKHTQIVVGGNPFADAIKGGQELLDMMTKIREDAKKQIKFTVDGLKQQPVNTKEGQTNIGISAADLNKQIKNMDLLTQKYSQAKASLTTLSEAQQKFLAMGEQERKALTNQIEALKQKQALEKADAKILATQEGSLQRLRAEYSKLEIQWRNAKIGSKEWNDLTAQMNQATKTLQAHEAEVGKHQRNVGNYPGIMGKVQTAWIGVAAAFTAVMVAGAGVISFFKSAVTAAMENEKANTGLKFALGGNMEIYDKLTSDKKEWQKTTTFTKEEINSSVNFAVSLGRTEEQTKKLITASMGLSKITGEDLQSSMTKLNGTYGGVTRGLTRYDGEIGNLSKAQLQAGVAVDLINAKLGRFATSGLETTVGKMAMFDKAWLQLKETLGNVFLPAIGKVAVAITDLVNGMTSLSTVSISGQIGEEKESINLLVGSITGLNEKSTLRKKLLEELMTSYPAYFGNIDKEKTTNAELITILKGVNSEYDKRIKLAVFGEDIAKLQKEGVNIFSQQRTNLAEINRLYELYIDKKKEDATTAEKLQALSKSTRIAGTQTEPIDVSRLALGLSMQYYELSGKQLVNDKAALAISAEQFAYEKKITEEKRVKGQLTAQELIDLKKGGAILTPKETAVVNDFGKAENANKLMLAKKTNTELQKIADDGQAEMASKSEKAFGILAENLLKKREVAAKKGTTIENKEGQQLLEDTKKLIDLAYEAMADGKDKELAKAKATYATDLLNIDKNSTQKLELQKGYEGKYLAEVDKINAAYKKKAEDEADKNRKIQIDTEKGIWQTRISEFQKDNPAYYTIQRDFLKQEALWDIEQSKGTTRDKLNIWIAYLVKLNNLKREETKNTTVKNKPAQSEDFATRAGIKSPEGEAQAPATTGAIGALGKDVYDLSGIKSKRDALVKERDEELALAKDSVDKQNEIWKEYYKADSELTKEAAQKKAQALQDFTGAVQQALGMVSEYYQQQYDKQKQGVEDAYDADKEKLDSQLAGKQISQTQYDAKMAVMDKKKKADELALEIDYKKKQKKIAIIQAIVNTAVAVTASLMSGGILGIVMAAITLALGIAEIALISSQTFAQGGHGYVDKNKGGVLQGKRHSQGGISLGDLGTAEQGEYFAVLNRNATSKYKDTLPLIFDALNQQKFDSMWSPKDVNIKLNAENKYDRLIYETLSKPKLKTETVVTEKYIIRKTGNHTEKILK